MLSAEGQQRESPDSRAGPSAPSLRNSQLLSSLRGGLHCLQPPTELERNL